MFGKKPRGVSERPKTKVSKDHVLPAWLKFGTLVLAALCLLVFLILWRPWQPIVKTQSQQQTTTTQNQETNTEYKFYDLLPQQKVTPIPEQAVPEHQAKQEVVVVEAPKATAEIEDPFEEDYATAKIPTPPRYILQAKSFEDPDSADARRAEIILNGLSAEVMIMNEGNKVWYRVISGPYESQDAARIAQQTLQNGGIDSIIVKQH